MKRAKYPTWERVSSKCHVSTEGQDGEPDFRIVRDDKTKRWCVKWRTSAHWSLTDYPTVTAAQRDIETQCAQAARKTPEMRLLAAIFR